MTTIAAYTVPAAKAPFERHAVRESDALIDIKFAGICHSGIHQAREGWCEAIFPMVAGHEIAGVASLDQGSHSGLGEPQGRHTPPKPDPMMTTR